MKFPTIIGTVRNSSGHFRPYLFVTNPKNIFPNRPPAESKLAIHEASSRLIWPEGKGESLEISRNTYTKSIKYFETFCLLLDKDRTHFPFNHLF